MRITWLLIGLVGCAAPAPPLDAGDWVYDAAPLTSCDQLQGNPWIPVGGVSGTLDTHVACVGALACGLCAVNAMCEDGRLRLSEAGRLCPPDTGAADASTDAAPSP